MDLLTVPPNVPRSALYAAAPFALIALALSLIRVYTTWSYYRTMKRVLHETPGKPSKKTTVEPPQIPYTLPYLGNSLAFLNIRPGAFWDKLFSWHPRSSGACTLLLGGRKTHILFTPSLVQAMFKDKTLKRNLFEYDLFKKVFLMPEEQIKNAENGKHHELEMNAAYLTRPERVNELTAKFTRELDEVLSKDSEDIVNKDSVGIYKWLRDRMFTASTIALLGSEVLKMYPEYCEDLFAFDNDFLRYYFDLPKFMMRDAVVRRVRIMSKLEEWSRVMHERNGGTPVDPEGPAWEPLFGSRLNRARQLDYKKRNLNARSASALDLGITFAISSNAIPATGWMLMLILNPKGDPTLYGRVMAELKKAELSDGSVDIPTLISSALLQSLFTETLRLYTDALVTRNLSEDTTLPLDEDGKTFIKMKKGEALIAPCWLGQHDPAAWPDDRAPYNVWCAERFLVPDPANPGQEVFSMTGTTGKFFPFGGGRTICPGRTFAKQEALGALAMVMLKFDFDVLGFTDKSGKEMDGFPDPADQFPGSGALVPGGDLRVRMRNRERSK